MGRTDMSETNDGVLADDAIIQPKIDNDIF